MAARTARFAASLACALAVAFVGSRFAIAATVWVTLRAANPKRRLYYWLLSDTLLIRRRRDLSEELKVIYGQRKLDSPRLVSIQVCQPRPT